MSSPRSALFTDLVTVATFSSGYFWLGLPQEMGRFNGDHFFSCKLHNLFTCITSFKSRIMKSRPHYRWKTQALVLNKPGDKDRTPWRKYQYCKVSNQIQPNWWASVCSLPLPALKPLMLPKYFSNPCKSQINSILPLYAILTVLCGVEEVGLSYEPPDFNGSYHIHYLKFFPSNTISEFKILYLLL